MRGIVFAIMVLAAVCLVAIVSFGLGDGTAGQARVQAEPAGGQSPASASQAETTSVGDAAVSEGREVADTAAGMAVFTARKCDLCHTVRVAGIGAPKAGVDLESVETSDAAGSHKEESLEAAEEDPMDLSAVASTRTAEWITLYLRGEESIEGVKHYKAFGGTEQEKAALVAWLMSLAASEKAPTSADSTAGREGDEAGDHSGVSGGTSTPTSTGQ